MEGSSRLGRISERVRRERTRALLRLRTLWSWERSAFGLPRALVSFLVLFVAGMALVSLVGDQGLVAYWMLRAEREQLKQDVQAHQTRERALLREIEALRSDPSYIEQRSPSTALTVFR